MKVYSIDVKIYGTVYIHADTEDEALKVANAMKMDAVEVYGEGDIVILDADASETRDVDCWLSSSMTIHGPDKGAKPSLVVDSEDEGEEA